MSTNETADAPESPYPREDFFAADDESEAPTTGHTEIDGTDAAEYLAFQHILALTYPVCKRTLKQTGEEVPLSDPCLYLPKQVERGSITINYRQHRHRRRINPDTGYINWGETTGTAVPEIDEETYMLAVQNYLSDRGILMTTAERKLQRARRLFHDPQFNSHTALATFIEQVRNDDI